MLRTEAVDRVRERDGRPARGSTRCRPRVKEVSGTAVRELALSAYTTDLALLRKPWTARNATVTYQHKLERPRAWPFQFTTR